MNSEKSENRKVKLRDISEYFRKEKKKTSYLRYTITRL